MKFLCTISFLLLACSCSVQPNVDLGNMTNLLWQGDIEYLNKKIRKEFKSFDPNVKSTFQINAQKLTEELAELDNHEVAIRIGQLVARLGDGHTEMSILQESASFERIPLIFYFFEDGLYVIAAQDEFVEHVGSKVIQIGNKSIPELQELLKSIMTYDNDNEILQTGPSFLQLPRVLQFLGVVESKSIIDLQLVNTDQESYTLNISAMTYKEYVNGNWKDYREIFDVKRPLYAKADQEANWFEYLEDEKLMYFHFGRVNSPKGETSLKKVINQLFDKIDDVRPEIIVIDMRRNRGGNYKKSRALVNGIVKRPEINQDGKLFVINGRTTFSAALVASIFLKKETASILIGEPSRGHPNKCDNVEYMDLPNSGLKIEYTTKVKKHWAQLGDLDHLPIDIEIGFRFEDYANGIDPVLNFLLKH